ncbi:MAG: sel1 repeat family protein, partial [Clostridia bacterium]|nr:sel1 repeat family protein [Clostridia bacterium]
DFMYYNGEGVAPDKAAAVMWWTKAADAGNAKAMCCLGYMYDKGEGVEQDKTAAVQWFTKAADLGREDAKMILLLLQQLEELSAEESPESESPVLTRRQQRAADKAARKAAKAEAKAEKLRLREEKKAAKLAK